LDEGSLDFIFGFSADAEFSKRIYKMKQHRSNRFAKPRTIDEYLARLSPDQRAALQKLRRDIRATEPNLEEYISYGVPAFRLNGKFLLAMGAAANHCAFYPGSNVQAFRKELKKYDLGKGTIRFQANDPLPSMLVRKLVRARVAERTARKKMRRRN
jgi:uncharacterized protein YdhG (YjbR/CyaY superfamily)